MMLLSTYSQDFTPKLPQHFTTSLFFFYLLTLSLLSSNDLEILHYEILSVGSGMRSVVKIIEHGRLVFIGGGERGSADLGWGQSTPPWAHSCGASSWCHIMWNPSKIRCQLDCRMTEAPGAKTKMNGAH
jgi:hypothetical protein